MKTALRIFEANEYEDDVKFIFGVSTLNPDVDWYPEEKDSVELPERLFYRLKYTGQAYEMHFPNLMPDENNDRKVLNHQQVQNIGAELAIVGDIMNDDLLFRQIEKIRLIITKVIQANGRKGLLIEGP